MTRIGYARTLTTSEDPSPLVDTLTAAGCSRTFVDHASRPLADRPELAAALAHLGEGDELVVPGLEHPARSTGDLVRLVTDLADRQVTFVSLAEDIDTSNPTHRAVFAALANLDRQLAAQRARPGSDAAKAAKARGARKGGRPPTLTPDKLATAKAMLATGDHTMEEIAQAVGVSRATLYRGLKDNR
jgi:DNA invertase Pin-like site-specific DNA recombinase